MGVWEIHTQGWGSWWNPLGDGPRPQDASLPAPCLFIFLRHPRRMEIILFIFSLVNFFFCFRKRATILRMFIVPETEVSGFTSITLFFTRNYILLNKRRIQERLRNLIKVIQQGRAQGGCSLESTMSSPRMANFLDGERELCLLLPFPPATLSASVSLSL